MTHFSFLIKPEYAVRIIGKVDADMTKRLVREVESKDGKAHFEDIADVKNGMEKSLVSRRFGRETQPFSASIVGIF